MEPKPTLESQAPPPQEESKPVKQKKPRSEAQQAATAKALAAMTARRKENIEKKKEVKEKIKVAKKVVEEKILKEDLRFASLNDIDSLKKDFMKELGELRGMLSAKQQVEKEKPVVAPKPERIVERVIERTPTPVAQPSKLTGHALLDKLFFEK